MSNPLAMYAGRKHLGPLDKAVISSHKSKMKFMRTVLLQEQIEELLDIEEKLKDEELTSIERLMIESVYKIKEAQFYNFLGIPYDGTNKNDQLPQT